MDDELLDDEAMEDEMAEDETDEETLDEDIDDAILLCTEDDEEDLTELEERLLEICPTDISTVLVPSM